MFPLNHAHHSTLYCFEVSAIVANHKVVLDAVLLWTRLEGGVFSYHLSEIKSVTNGFNYVFLPL